MVDGSHVDPVFTGQSDSGHLGLWLLQLLSNKGSRFLTAFACQMAGVTDFYFVIVYPQINQAGGFAANDDFVITGMFQFRSEISSE